MDNQNGNLIVPTPPVTQYSKRKLALTVLGVIIFLALIVGISGRLYFITGRNKTTSSSSGSSQSSVSAIPAVTLNQERVLVNSNSKMTFPEVSTSSSIASALLPADLSALILASATPAVISQLTFADGSQGYAIAYGGADQANNVYNKFQLVFIKDGMIQQSRYSLVSQSNTALAGTLEEQSSKYQVKIDVNSVQAGSLINIMARLIK